MYDTLPDGVTAQRGAAAYSTAARQSGRPGARLDLVLEAYDRVLTALGQAAAADRAGQLDAEFRAAIEAVMLFQGLATMVDPAAGEMAQTLKRTYAALERALHSIIRTPNGAPHYERLQGAVGELRDAWRICALKT
jgi:flagellin-specific chaperone FliS